MNKEQWPKIDVTIKKEAGFLHDSQIAHAISKGRLITDAHPSGAKYACYELHIGGTIQQLVLDSVPGSESDLYKVKNIGQDGVFQINPGETFKLYASESLYMPADIFGIAIPVGNMYKLGLIPETTFADPGFSGAFYVTVSNYSPRIVKLKVGDPLARMFFCKLHDRPDKIHDGNPRDVPPTIERVRRPTVDELNAEGEPKVMNDVLNASDPPHYQHAYVTHRLVSHHRAATDERLQAVRAEVTQQHTQLRGRIDTALADTRRSVAAAFLIAAGTSFVVLILAGIAACALLYSKWPTFSEGMWASVAASVIWLLVLFIVGPFRRSFWTAIREMSDSGPADGKE